MIDASDHFLTFAPENPDFTYDDEKREAVAMADRNEHIIQVMQGDGDLDDFLERLYQDGIDPLQWMTEAAEGLGAIVDAGRVYVSNDYGILLPV